MPVDLTTVFKNITSRISALESRPRASMSYQNIAVNGGLEVWSAGAGPFTADGASCADTWLLSVVGPSSISVSKDTTHQDIFYSQVCAAISVSGAASIVHTVSGAFVGGPNSKLSLTARVRTAVAGAVRLRIGTVVGDYHSGSDQYETLLVIGVPASNPFDIAIDVLSSATVYVDNIMLVQGGSPIDYVSLTAQDNLRRITDY